MEQYPSSGLELVDTSGCLGTAFTTPSPNLILANQALSRGREGKTKVSLLSGVMDSRLKGTQKAGQQPLPAQDSTCPSWEQPEGLASPVLALSACPRHKRVWQGNPVLEERKSLARITQNRVPDPRVARSPRKENSLIRKARNIQKTRHPEVARARGLGQFPALLQFPVTA